MSLDAVSLTASLRAELALEFPDASQDELELAVRAALSVFEEARVQTFLPILAGREARRMLASGASGRRPELGRGGLVLPDVREEAVSVG